jgi:hypothetical protein
LGDGVGGGFAALVRLREMMTAAPFSAIARAVAIPIPDVPPVIKARLSLKSFVTSFKLDYKTHSKRFDSDDNGLFKP